MKLAAIDIGSNSIHMIIVDVGPGGSFRVMDREKDMIGLGRGTLETSYLDEDAMARGVAALRKAVKLARRHGVDEVLAVTTSAVREALNGGDFLERVREATGIEVRVITALEEARLIGLAVLEGIELGGSRSVVIDIGGGSVEMILLEKGKVLLAESFKLGVIRLAERFVDDTGRVSRTGRRELAGYVRDVTARFLRKVARLGFEHVVGTSGTILALGSLATGVRPTGPEGEALNGHTVTFAALAQTAERLANMRAVERARLPGIDEKRADTIVPGAFLLVALLDRLGAARLVLCDRALREGLVLDYLRTNRVRLGRLAALPGPRARSVLELAERCGYDARHAEQVARLALQLFDETRSLHGLGATERELLTHAAHLHDIGIHIAFEGHERHGYYLVKNGGLAGFPPDEIELLAGVVLYHRSRPPRRDDPSYVALAKPDRRVLRKLAGLLRLADGLDRSHFQVLRELKVQVSGPVVTLSLDAREDPELELWAASRKGRLFERTTGARLRFVLRGVGAPRRDSLPAAG